MLAVVKMEWKREDVPKVVETRSKLGAGGQGVEVLAEATLFGQHKYIGIWEATDEKAVFKALAPYLGITFCEVIPAVTPDEAIKIVTGK
jgi:hypothetical protein